MEVCFLSSSNSFVKNTAPPPTHDLSVSSHKVTNKSLFTSPNYSKARSRRYQHRQLKKLKDTFPSSSSNICCALNKPSSSNDDEIDKPSASAGGGDWRSFRAKLVAAERAPTPEQRPIDDAEDADRPLDDNHHRPCTVLLGERWAHPIHEPEKGCLLIATEKLDGVHIFERTVILLLSTGPIGPTGVIINRPSLMSIKETRSSRFDVGGTFSDLPLFFGGPLEEGLFLVGSKTSSSSSGDDGNGAVGLVFDEVMKGLSYGTKESIGCAAAMVKRNTLGLDDFRFFDGYCGWDKEQLREEIRSGYWTVAACSPSVIGLSAVGTRGLWEDVLGLMGPRKVW